MISPELLVAPFVGFEYADHGRGPTRFDCWGLCLHVYRELLDRNLPPLDLEYDRSVKDPSVTALFRREMTQSIYDRVKKPEAFDIIVFNIAGKPAHCGVMVGAARFLHIHSGVGSCVENVSSSRWSARIEGFYRPVR